MRVLIVDDDIVLLDVLRQYLSEHDIDIKTASSGDEALKMIKESRFDLVVLDINLPRMSGLEVLKSIQCDYSGIPVVMLTAKSEIGDRITGLELGADDYIVKPFDYRELLARIRSVVRRAGKSSSEGKPEEGCQDSIELDELKREVRKRGKPIPLTSVEYEILSIFVKNRGLVLSRDRIMDLARGKDFVAFDRSIDMHISHLRGKLEDDPANPRLIKTVWGSGYLFSGGL